MFKFDGIDARRTIWAVAFLLGTAIVTASAYTAVSRRSATLDEASDDLVSVLDSVSQDLTGTFELSNTVLTSLYNSIRASDGTIEQLQTVSRDVAVIAHAAPRLREVLFAEVGGWVLASSLQENGINRNVAREPFFREASGSDTPQVIVTRAKTDDGVAVSRQVNLPDGSATGVVATVVPRSYFLQTYTSFDAGRGIRVELQRQDGASLLSYGNAQSADAVRIDRNLAPLPFAVAVSWSQASMLQDWSRKLPLQVVTTFGLLVLIAIVAYLLSRLLDRKEVEKRSLAAQAVTDPLTGLGNRRRLIDSIRAAINDRSSSGFAVALFDLDRFKAVNDTYGHAAGDLVLTTVAGHLDHLLGAYGTVARLGGDEFAAVIRDSGPELDLTKLLATTQQALLQPIDWGNARLTIGASAGVARFPYDGEDGDTLLQRADLAMYHAKQNRVNEVRFFEAGMEAGRQARQQREGELRLALQTGEIRPYYQPIVAFPDRKVVAFELLARWHHPILGILPPSEFIALAEDTKLITPLTIELIRQFAIDAAVWPSGIRIAINISPRQLREPLLAHQIIEALRAGGLDPSRVEIELTEDGILDDYQFAKSVLSIFRLHGMTLALDDFGTGYSSLLHLRELRFDRLKIDRSFVQKLPDDRESEKLVDAILQLATSFDLAVTAEGIETDDQAALLSAYGSISGQGFLFGRPMSGSDALQLLSRAESAAA